MWTTNLTSASKSSTFGRVNQTIASTVLRSLFLTKSRKETSLAWIINLTSVTAVAQCANKYKITHSPLRSITAFHCFADMHTIRQTHKKGKSVQISPCQGSYFVTISTVPPVEIAKTASLLQVTPSFKKLSQYDVWPFSSIKTTSLSVKCRFLTCL